MSCSEGHIWTTAGTVDLNGRRCDCGAAVWSDPKPVAQCGWDYAGLLEHYTAATARAEAAERVQEGLRVELQRAEGNLETWKIICQDSQKSAVLLGQQLHEAREQIARMQNTIDALSDSDEVAALTTALEDVKAGRTVPFSEIRAERDARLTRADAEAIAREAFKSWRKNLVCQITAHDLDWCEELLRRAFQGSAEPPTPGPKRHDIATDNPKLDGVCCVVSLDGRTMCIKERGHTDPHGDENDGHQWPPVSAPERPTRETPEEQSWADWARFVFLNGGDTPKDTEVLRSAVCHKWDSLKRALAAAEAHRELACEHCTTIERDTLARVRAAVEAVDVEGQTDLGEDPVDGFYAGRAAALRALDALAASASDHREPQ